MIVINPAVREYQLTANWKYAAECRFFWKVYDLIRTYFGWNLPDCIFRCEPMHRMRQIRCVSVNGFGGKHDITLNARLLGMSKLEAFFIVTHGTLHVWDDCNGTNTECGRHSAAFQREAARIGIPARGGRVCKVIDPSPEIIAFAAEHFPDYLSPLRPGLAYPIAPVAKSFIYVCPCRLITVPNKISYKCGGCGQVLRLVTNSERVNYFCDCTEFPADVPVDYFCMKCNRPVMRRNEKDSNQTRESAGIAAPQLTRLDAMR